MVNNADKYNGAPHDGTAWMIAAVDQNRIITAGGTLRQRIQLTQMMASNVRAQLIKKNGEIKKDAKGDKTGTKDQLTIEGIISLINGTPCPNGVCKRDGIIHKYNPRMDSEDVQFNSESAGDLQVMLNDIWLDIDDIICRNNLSSQDIMALVSMNKSGLQRMKE